MFERNFSMIKLQSQWNRRQYFSHFYFITSTTYMIIIIFASITGGTIASNLSRNLTTGKQQAITTNNNNNNRSYFTVYRLNPETEGQAKFLYGLLINNTKLDFWKVPRIAGGQVHVMVPGTIKDDFLRTITEQNVTYSVMIDDVEKRIRKLRESTKKPRGSNWLRDEPLTQQRNFNLAKYHSYDEIIKYLKELAATYPDRVRVMSIGGTHEGREIVLVIIGKPAKFRKPGIWIDGGIHAREWISPATVLYIIDRLVKGYTENEQIRRFVDEMDWFIVPLLNPDGYEYTRSSTHPEVRLWRKNRSPMICRISHRGLFAQPQQECCQGVDLNRNYDWQYGMEGSSTDPCSEIYQGPYAFSEPETRAVRMFIVKRRNIIKTFLTFHSYSQILMYPYGHRQRTYTSDVNDLRNIALQAANALRAEYGTVYTVGTGADTLYPASGGAEDWAKGRMGIKYSYLFELRPEEQVWDGFLLDEKQIIPTARETFEAVKVIANRAHAMFSSKNPINVQDRNSRKLMCVDREAYCAFWAQQGYCATWGIMRRVCAYSCGFCVPLRLRDLSNVET